jgi:CubicO group peptidase (beta-lactamase class C family)
LSFSAGSICSDIRDLLLWENALMEGRFLSPSGWDSVFDPGAFNYGFGWRINGDYYYHGGQTAGYNTFVLIEPSSATVIIALSNIQGTDGYFSEGVVRSDQVGFEIYSIMQHSDTEKINENRGYEPDA